MAYDKYDLPNCYGKWEYGEEECEECDCADDCENETRMQKKNSDRSSFYSHRTQTVAQDRSRSFSPAKRPETIRDSRQECRSLAQMPSQRYLHAKMCLPSRSRGSPYKQVFRKAGCRAAAVFLREISDWLEESELWRYAEDIHEDDYMYYDSFNDQYPRRR